MRTVRYLTLASAGLISLTTPVLAQETTRDGDVNAGVVSVEEIVVTARRREESIQDVPQTVNVVTADQIQKLNLRSFTDLQAVVPGLTLTRATTFDSSATVRGIAYAPQASGNNPSVEFYLNDAPISSNFIFQSLFDVGQFELLRGPQGTLRGRASPSGSFTFTTRRPDLGEFGGVVNGTTTDIEAHKIDGALNVPIIRDKLAVRVAGVWDESEGDRVTTIKQDTDPARNPDPRQDIKAGRISLRFQPADWLETNVMYQSLTAKTRSYRQVVSADNVTGAPITGRSIGWFDNLSIDDQGAPGYSSQDSLTANIDVRFAGQKVSYVGGYSKQDFASFGMQDFGDFFAPPRFAIVERTFNDRPGEEPVCQQQARRTNFVPTTGAYYQCTHGKGTRDSHELRVASEERIADVFDYVVGAFYDHNDNPSRLTSETPILRDLSTVATVNLASIRRDGDSTEKSYFGNLTAHLGQFELSGGVRYIDYESFSSLIQNGARPIPDTEDRDNATIYSVSVKYQINDDLMVYANTGSSWRSGPRAVGNFSTTRTARETRFLDLPPEESKSYELGARWSFLDNRARLNVSAYHQEFENYPFRGNSIFYINRQPGTAVDNVASFNYLAAVPVDVDGVETEASFQILPQWSIAANASYAKGEIKNGTIACNDFNGDGVPDNNPPTPTLAQLQAAVGPGEHISQCSGIDQRASYTPKFSANLQSEYGLNLTARLDGFARALVTFYGKSPGDPSTDFDDVGSYALTNLYLGVRDPDGAWDVTLYGKNIFRERETLPGNSSLGGGPLGTPVSNSLRVGAGSATYVSDYYLVRMTPPREFGVSLRYAFGSR